MARMAVIIDGRRARAGAEVFAAAQEQMRTSARRTQEDISRANQATVADVLAGLDREISRRQAVREAQSRGIEEGRIEARAQEVINGLRAKGIVLSQQEIQQIREKARASQELANAIEGTIRAQRNQDQAQAIANASHGRSFERATQGDQFGPVTQEQHLEQVRRQTEALSRSLNNARGWIGDVGDAFDYVGQQILGFSDAQSQAISTTIMMTEKGMALGEVFGPQYALWGAVGGAVLGVAAALREEIKARQALFREMDLYQKKLAESVAETESQKYYERLFLGTEKLRLSLSELREINVSDITSQFEKMSKIKLEVATPFSDGTEGFEKAQAVILQNHKKWIEDVRRGYAGMREGLRGLSEESNRVAAAETTNIAALQGRLAEAEAYKKRVQAETDAQIKKLGEEEKKWIDIQEAAFRAYQQDPTNIEKQKAYQKALGDSAQAMTEIDKAQRVAREAQKIGTDRVTEAQDKLNDALAKAPWLLDRVADSAKKAFKESAAGTFWDNLTSDAFKKKLEDKKSADEAAATAAKNAAKQRAESLAKQQEQLAAQEAIWAAYQKGGEEAAKIEEKYQAAIAGQRFSASQLAQTRANVEAQIAGEERLRKAREDTANASKAFADKIKDSHKAYTDAVADAKKALEDLEKIEDEATKPGSDLAEKQQSPMQAWMEQYDSLLDAQANFESMMIGSFDNIAGSLAQTLWGVDVDWRETMKSMGIELTALLLKMLAAAALKAVITGATGGAAGGLGAALGAGVIGDLIIGGSFHSGGPVSGGGSPVMAPASLWAGAPRFHGGLKPDEFPAILQTGEEVLSRRQVAEGRASGRTTTVINNWSFPGVRDSRGMDRSLNQGARRLGRMLGVNHDD